MGRRVGGLLVVWVAAACADEGRATTQLPVTMGPTTDGPGGASSTGPDSSTGEPTSETPTGPGPTCGDGQLDAGEQCDDGPANADDAACTSTCTSAVCGDGLVHADVEPCDDGNLEPGDGCDPACALESCGDGVVQGVEGCDDGDADDTDECLSSCVLATCGDGALWAGMEACDDGNQDDGDACLATCEPASCGDGAVWVDMEACDDGNQIDGDQCTAQCELAGCTDKLKNADESDVDCGGASCPKCALGLTCNADGDCASATCLMNECAPPASCKAILAADPAAATGEYSLDLDGAGPLPAFKAICDMTTDGGGWTVFYATNGTDAQQPLTGNTDVLGNDPLKFLPYNLSRARKIALSQISAQTLFARSGGVWLRADKAAFDANLNAPNTISKGPVTLTASDGMSAPAYMGYANFNIPGGGDFGLSMAPDAATCDGATIQGFDHHGPNYYMLNCGCQRQYLYSYSAQFADSDAGYDVNTPLGAWSATAACHSAEGGVLQFYAAMR